MDAVTTSTRFNVRNVRDATATVVAPRGFPPFNSGTHLIPLGAVASYRWDQRTRLQGLFTSDPIRLKQIVSNLAINGIDSQG
jgi:hypothetical protein